MEHLVFLQRADGYWDFGIASKYPTVVISTRIMDKGDVSDRSNVAMTKISIQ